MTLSDSPEMRVLRSPPRRSVEAKTNKHWSDGQKLEAVQTYLMLGSVRMASAALKIPFDTIKTWKATTWWKELENELRIQDELQLSTRLQKIAEKSFAVVEDRLEHGNYVFDQKTGNLKRVPVNMKDAHTVALDAINKRDMINGRQTVQINDGQIADKLLQLAEKFAEIARSSYDQKRTVDAEIVSVEAENQPDNSDMEDESSSDNYEGDLDDAVYEERSTGLST